MSGIRRQAGRPKADINWQQVSQYAEAGASGVGIAAVIGVDEATLRNRCQTDNNLSFSEYLQQKRAKGDEHLRDKQYEVAMTGNVPMLIWVGKNRLGQADKQEITTDPKLTDLKQRIQARADEKGVEYRVELELFLNSYSDNIDAGIKSKLSSELVQ